MNNYAQLADAFRLHLAPEGPLEETLVDEIISAAWRLRRCAEDDDKSRNFAHRILRNCVADLRRLQTNRQIREELDPEALHTGLAGYCELLAARKTRTVFPKENWVRSAQETSDPAGTAAPASNTPRNALCPCGSQEKFKRCCGKDAPPVLHQTPAGTQIMPKAA